MTKNSEKNSDFCEIKIKQMISINSLISESINNMIDFQRRFSNSNNILEEFNEIFLKSLSSVFLSQEISHLFNIKPFNINQIVNFSIYLIENNIPNDSIHSDLLNILISNSPKLLYQLFKLNYYEIQEIILIIIKKNEVFSSLFFIKYITDIKFFYSKFSNYNFIMKNYSIYFENNFLLLNELILYGCEKNSLQYLIKFDLIDLFQLYIYNNNINLNELIKLSPFENIINENIISLIDLSAFYSSILCFKFLELNNILITLNTLKFAIAGGNFEIIHLCLNKVQINFEILKICSLYKKFDLFHWFLCNFNKEDLNPCELISTNNLYTFLKSIELGSNINKLDKNGFSSLYYIILYGYSDLIEFLISNNFIINLKNNFFSPLHLCCKNGQFQILNFLLTKINQINIKDNIHYTPLHYAILNNNIQIIELLLLKGIDVNICTDTIFNFFFFKFIIIFLFILHQKKDMLK